MNNKHYNVAIWALRISLAFAFIYPAIAASINPDAWIGFFPGFIQDLLPADVLLSLWGGVELLIAVTLLFLPKPHIPALISAFLLIFVVITNINLIDVVFRDLSLAGMAIALALLGEKPSLQPLPATTNEPTKINQ